MPFAGVQNMGRLLYTLCMNAIKLAFATIFKLNVALWAHSIAICSSPRFFFIYYFESVFSRFSFSIFWSICSFYIRLCGLFKISIHSFRIFFFSSSSSALGAFFLFFCFFNLLYWCYLWCFSSWIRCYDSMLPLHFVKSTRKLWMTQRKKNCPRLTEYCRQLDCRHFCYNVSPNARIKDIHNDTCNYRHRALHASHMK